ncbi:hypothetical protein H0H81_004211 [Sphagnurus paluster]|uniref:SUZ domain-containing protein n=1 Tax=Sphagnurus paluster TaxID=117069 RepID=A0A9P7GNR5_9AGAR|nr:hypothetical protein H0H81_004211 [Sphagnurus paluster]
MAAASSSSQQTSDSWEVPSHPSSSRRRPSAPAQPIPDDWDDDEPEEPQTEEDNQRIWEDANAKEPNPMPALIISPSSTSSNQVLSPPLAAFKPKMRILKRPVSNTSSNPTTPSSSTLAESLQEREARYQEARDRIFGSADGSKSPTSDTNMNDSSNSPNSSKDRRERRGQLSQNTNGVEVIRNPRGPPGVSADNFPPKGFGGERAKPPQSAGNSQVAR